MTTNNVISLCDFRTKRNIEKEKEREEWHRKTFGPYEDFVGDFLEATGMTLPGDKFQEEDCPPPFFASDDIPF